ncbi:MAG: AAA domain-containing protein [Bacteroides sp.]|nr:AAA domain-containing protein [Bacteroides sp.]
MDLQKHVILIGGIDKTYQVESIWLDVYKFAIKFTNNVKVYSYKRDNVVWMTNPVAIELANSYIYINGRHDKSVKSLHLFTDGVRKYYAVTFENDFVKHFKSDEIEVRRSCLTGTAVNVFDYFKQCAAVNTLGLSEESNPQEESILSSIYSRIDFVDDTTAAAAYLNPQKGVLKRQTNSPIFPFGCNASQQRAVISALANQISVIQGPPGTGKTQTILNIIANLLIDNKSVLVVSNNNSATENVLEKLQKNGFGFLVAPLGCKENREAFIANQPRLNPEIPSWRISQSELSNVRSEAKNTLMSVKEVFDLQERLAICRQELAEVKIEKIHFEQENPIEFESSDIKIHSFKILNILDKLKTFYARYETNESGIWERIKSFIYKFDLDVRLRLSLKIKTELSKDSIPGILTLVELLFYQKRIAELEQEISTIETSLQQSDADALMRTLTSSSMAVLKAKLAKRFSSERQPIASIKEMFYNGARVLQDYPVVLSTTFSSRLCFDKETIFDYVIMDEASQVAVDTGFLALTCAKNAVIVGDTMQLPNVITENDEAKLSAVMESYNVADSYNAVKHSFLSSVLDTIPNVPETLLREHYRCHPDIINFCNQKFYGGNLLIMTKRHDGDAPLLTIATNEGKHCRGHFNQREIDTVKLELLPILENPSEIGIIAPYNSQVNQFRAQIPMVESATVHKYQGREKDTIIMSVTDDQITEFADNANLLNVAVSRAKEKFCLVVSGNPQELNGNIHDLLGYIRYNKGTVIKSKLHSIYDYLFSEIEAHSRSRISDYESENLTYDLIESIRRSYPQLSHIKVLCHYPFRCLIGDVAGLTEREAKYATHPSTHVDFLIINRVSKEPLLAIETDGYSFHNETTEQSHRDKMKDHILDMVGLPLLRLSTIGHSEEEKIVNALNIKLKNIHKVAF